MPDVPRVKPDQVSARWSAFGRRTVAGSASFLPATPPAGTTTPVRNAWSAGLDSLIENVADILDSEVALYCRLDSLGQPPEVVCSSGLGALREALARPGYGGLVDRALEGQSAVLEPLDPVHDAALIAAAGEPTPQYALIAPMRPAAGAAAALIALVSARPADEALSLWTAEACGAMLALGAQRPEMLDGLLLASRRDALTGCLNYAGTRRELEKEINRSTRGGSDLSLGFIDLDDFKRVNDQHGHLRGNEVLREVSQVLHESVRSCDTVGRFGGDEFIVILPDTDERGAMQFAAHLGSRMADASISAVGGPLTASVGVASWTPGTTADELLASADQALLSAKTDTRALADRQASAEAGVRAAAALP